MSGRPISDGADTSGTAAITPRAAISDDPVPEPPKFLSREDFFALVQSIPRLQPGNTSIEIDSHWRSDVRWARNRITMAGDWRLTEVDLGRGNAGVSLNQLDATSLRNAIDWAEQVRQRFEGGPPAPQGPSPQYAPQYTSQTFPATAIWSDKTYAQTQDTRLDVAQRVIERAHAAGMWTSGYMGVEAFGRYSVIQENGLIDVPMTLAQCSITVRSPDGTGSGWAGRSSYDWSRLGAEQLAATALEKCLASRNPVRIEPGRYTLIMEPQATFEFTRSLFGQLGLPWYFWLKWTLNYEKATFRGTRHTTVPVSNYGPPVELISTKIGERVFDERINLHFDPVDPDLGGAPFIWDPGNADGHYLYPKQPARWVTNGVLTELGYGPGEHRGSIDHYNGPINSNGIPFTGSFRMDGSGRLTSVNAMIATTERGLIVTRFWDPRLVDRDSMLLTGTTRDGLWMIERGKITRPVRNLRWTDSPMFVLNKVEQIGASVPIFNPGTPCVVPPLKVREFNFTMIEDAI